MKKGESLNGYTLLSDFTTAGGGLCKWAVAEKEGKRFFVKQFLRPVFPVEGSPGSSAKLEEQERRCKTFELDHCHRMAAINEVPSLVVEREFFRSGTKYFKTTDHVCGEHLQLREVNRLSRIQRRSLMRSLTRAVKEMHAGNIVHGDLKPDNVLVSRRSGRCRSYLIDLDDCFVSQSPPSAEELVGDMVYYSPEVARYVCGAGNGPSLTEASDIFSLGLLFHVWLCGSLPSWEGRFRYPHEAVNGGTRLGLTCDSEEFEVLLSGMLERSSSNRPSIDEVYAALCPHQGAPLMLPPPRRLSGSLIRQAVAW